MIAAPWYLLAAGIVLVIVGLLAGGLSGPSRHKPKAIHHKMRDEDIIRHLNQSESLSFSALISFLGYVLIFISIVWRLVRYFV